MSEADGTMRRRRLTYGAVSIATVIVVLAAAVGAAAASGSSGGGVTGWVETLSSRFATVLSRLGSLLTLGYAFGAGAVSAVNPCGFAMLPVYLGLYLGAPAGAGGIAAEASALPLLKRSLIVTASVTAGFIALFGAVGLLVGLGAREVTHIFPQIGLAVGVILVGAGGWLMSGRTFYARIGEQAASRVGDVRRVGPRGYFAFGAAYGTASLSCTLPIFLTVIAGGMTAGSLGGAAAQLVLYALGMGSVVLILTISLSFFRGTLVAALRSAVRYMQPLTIALLYLSGAYLVFYWLTVGGLLSSAA